MSQASPNTESSSKPNGGGGAKRTNAVAAPVSCFARLRADVMECLALIGAPVNVAVRGVSIDLGDGGTWSIPFFAPPEMDRLERLVIEALQKASGPLQQKELSRAIGVSIRLIQRVTPKLQDRGLLVRHPSLGFYLPGHQFSDD